MIETRSNCLEAIPVTRIPVLIDCDPGVDDAFALALAQSCPHFDIRAITAVYGNMPLKKTLYNARALNEVLAIGAQVAAGAKEPFFKKYDRGDDYVSPVHGSTGIASILLPEGRQPLDEDEACDVIYREAVRAGGELLLFAVGPLTNVAKALMRYPDLPGLISRFYIMGGGIEMGNQSPYAEANIFKDPTAARICFEKLPTHMVGLNATCDGALSEADLNELIAACGDGPRAALLKELFAYSRHNAFVKGQDSNIIHDAIAVAWAMDDAVCGGEERRVWVRDDAGDRDGETVADPVGTAPANAQVAMTTDTARYKALLLQMCRYYREME
nr:nucleoside hydrolase [Acetanaerobacterium sp. MSJ-12]